MINEPLVSICTPCYNHEQYLDDYFKSITNQTYSNLELIIIDDASRDDSPVIIDKWAKKLEERFKRIVFIKREENKGIVYNCNELIKLAQGEYIKLFASDDVMLKNCIHDSVMFLESHPDYGLCYSNAYSIPNSFKYNNISKINKFRKIRCNLKISSKNDMFLKLLSRNFIVAPTVLVKKVTYEKFGPYDTKIGYEDHDYWFKVCLKEKIGYIHKYTVGYRESITSISHCTFNDKDKEQKYKYMYINSKKIRKKYFRYLNEKEKKTVIDNFYILHFNGALTGLIDSKIVRLYKIIKKRDINLDFRLKLKYLLYRCHILYLIKLIKNLIKLIKNLIYEEYCWLLYF